MGTDYIKYLIIYYYCKNHSGWQGAHSVIPLSNVPFVHRHSLVCIMRVLGHVLSQAEEFAEELHSLLISQIYCNLCYHE